MKKFSMNEFYEIISEPIVLNELKTVQHAELPEVDDELSVSLRMRLKSHHSGWAGIFQKGIETEGNFNRTPGLFLFANNSRLHPRFTGNWNNNAGIEAVTDGLLLNKWYHITYTLSDRQMHNVKFNDGPLHIGCFDGEIG
ncbi:unnamed protein product [Rhizophagus irregularis]|uniref:Concanavalin A-like lectin/glucanase n=2 Tax=Rhizophagus irregularis TaxID=588596 RepID=A0A915ZP03_9GLOM|nr:unnamed protein product [Rhizophagus irregularis]CAB5180624.1 unnamed protein product [Rhizophagus irregularis]CAB5385111.1 unnamed protein product [Rhizophagus irregularis]